MKLTSPQPAGTAGRTLFISLAALALVACGGGGGSTEGNPEAGGGSGIPSTATASFTPSQAAAAALVADVVQHTRDMRLASGLTATQLGAASGSADTTPLLARDLRHAQAVSDYSGTLCSSGSASLNVADTILQRFNDADTANDTLNQGEGMSMAAHRCVVKAAGALGAVSLGSFGTGDTIDGSFALTLTTRAGNDLVWTLKYTGFSYTPFGGTAFAPLDATLVFGNVGGVDTYALDIPGTRLLSAPRISQVGNTVTVTGGSLRSQIPTAAGSGHADYAYAGWVMDSVSLSASAGSVSLAGASGSQARVSAGATAYAVRFTVGGVVSSFTVAR